MPMHSVDTTTTTTPPRTTTTSSKNKIKSALALFESTIDKNNNYNNVNVNNNNNGSLNNSGSFHHSSSSCCTTTTSSSAKSPVKYHTTTTSTTTTTKTICSPSKKRILTPTSTFNKNTFLSSPSNCIHSLSPNNNEKHLVPGQLQLQQQKNTKLHQQQHQQRLTQSNHEKRTKTKTTRTLKLDFTPQQPSRISSGGGGGGSSSSSSIITTTSNHRTLLSSSSSTGQKSPTNSIIIQQQQQQQQQQKEQQQIKQPNESPIQYKQRQPPNYPHRILSPTMKYHTRNQVTMDSGGNISSNSNSNINISGSGSGSGSGSDIHSTMNVPPKLWIGSLDTPNPSSTTTTTVNTNPSSCSGRKSTTSSSVIEERSTTTNDKQQIGTTIRKPSSSSCLSQQKYYNNQQQQQQEQQQQQQQIIIIPKIKKRHSIGNITKEVIIHQQQVQQQTQTQKEKRRGSFNHTTTQSQSPTTHVSTGQKINTTRAPSFPPSLPILSPSPTNTATTTTTTTTSPPLPKISIMKSTLPLTLDQLDTVQGTIMKKKLHQQILEDGCCSENFSTEQLLTTHIQKMNLIKKSICDPPSMVVVVVSPKNNSRDCTFNFSSSSSSLPSLSTDDHYNNNQYMNQLLLNTNNKQQSIATKTTTISCKHDNIQTVPSISTSPPQKQTSPLQKLKQIKDYLWNKPNGGTTTNDRPNDNTTNISGFIGDKNNHRNNSTCNDTTTTTIRRQGKLQNKSHSDRNLYLSINSDHDHQPKMNLLVQQQKKETLNGGCVGIGDQNSNSKVSSIQNPKQHNNTTMMVTSSITSKLNDQHFIISPTQQRTHSLQHIPILRSRTNQLRSTNELPVNDEKNDETTLRGNVSSSKKIVEQTKFTRSHNEKNWFKQKVGTMDRRNSEGTTGLVISRDVHSLIQNNKSLNDSDRSLDPNLLHQKSPIQSPIQSPVVKKSPFYHNHSPNNNNSNANTPPRRKSSPPTLIAKPPLVQVVNKMVTHENSGMQDDLMTTTPKLASPRRKTIRKIRVSITNSANKINGDTATLVKESALVQPSNGCNTTHALPNSKKVGVLTMNSPQKGKQQHIPLDQLNESKMSGSNALILEKIRSSWNTDENITVQQKIGNKVDDEKPKNQLTKNFAVFQKRKEKFVLAKKSPSVSSLFVSKRSMNPLDDITLNSSAPELKNDTSSDLVSILRVSGGSSINQNRVRFDEQDLQSTKDMLRREASFRKGNGISSRKKIKKKRGSADAARRIQGATRIQRTIRGWISRHGHRREILQLQIFLVECRKQNELKTIQGEKWDKMNMNRIHLEEKYQKTNVNAQLGEKLSDLLALENEKIQSNNSLLKKYCDHLRVVNEHLQNRTVDLHANYAVLKYSTNMMDRENNKLLDEMDILKYTVLQVERNLNAVNESLATGERQRE